MVAAVWTPGMSVGIEVIDDDHRYLLAIIETLADALRCNQHMLALAEADRFLDVMRLHCRREEDFLHRAAYPRAASHAVHHRHVLAEVEAVRRRLAQASELADVADSALRLFRLFMTALHTADMDFKWFFLDRPRPLPSLPPLADVVEEPVA